MHARSITFMADPARLDDGIALIRDQVMPLLTSTDGSLGVSALVDRDTGLCIVTSAWRTADALRADDRTPAAVQALAAEVGAGNPQSAEWEVAVMHRARLAPEGSCCRVTWLRLGHGDVDRGIELYRSALLPEMESLEGFCSASLLVDRAAGRACSTTTYDSRAALEATRERSWAIRDTGVRETGVDVLDVSECDLVLAHLHLPELV